MEIKILTSELKFDIKNKSHNEVSSIEDVNLRYMAEAGTEKESEIDRCIIEAEARVRLVCGRFLKRVTASTPQNNALPESLPESYTYEFVDNPRRLDNKEKAMADSIHFAIVNLALSKFYVSVSQTGLANTHDAMATNALSLIENALYDKLPPVQPTIN